MTSGQTTMKNKTTKHAHIMRQTILFLLSLLAPACASAQVAKVYKNGVLVNAFTDNDTIKYKVVFGTHDYVEIGGLKWATMNIGATSIAETAETAYGDYYAWGEIDTYYTAITDTLVSKYSDLTHIKGLKTEYNQNNYYGVGSSEWKPEPYDTQTNTLLPEYDIARQEWGGKWRMPTTEEVCSLISACSDNATYTRISGETSITTGGIYWLAANTTVDKTTYNVEGVLLVAKEDTGKRLFFPAAGLTMNKTRELNLDKNKNIAIWTSSAVSESKEYGMSLYIASSNNNVYPNNKATRYLGFSVRPVCE